MKMLFAICALFIATCSTQAQTQPLPAMDASTFQYFTQLGLKYLDSTASQPANVVISSKVGVNPVSNANPTPPSLTPVATGTGRGKKDLGIRQTIVFDRYGNSRLITTVGIR